MHILCGPADASSFPVASYHSLDPCTDKEAMRNQKSDYLVRRTLLAVYEDLIGCCIRLHPYVMMDSRVPSRIPVMESAIR